MTKVRKVRNATPQHDLLKRYFSVVEELRKELGRDPTDEEVEQSSGINPTLLKNYEFDEQEEEGLELLIRVGVSNNNLRSTRLELGLHQQEVSKICGMPIQAYSMIERCNRMPTESEAEKISILFKKPREYLFPQWMEIFTQKWKRMEKQRTVVLKHEQLNSPEVLALESGADMILGADRQLLKKLVKDCMTELTPREEKVLDMRYGLTDGIFHTLDEVANEFDVSRERMRQIEAKALDKMQSSPNFEKIRKNF